MNQADPINVGSLVSINFGNGLVEICALATLIGSTTAAAFVLGNRGPGGLVWGSITPFGSSSVIKACGGAASPGWLRHMLGLRTLASDEAVGMDLSLAPDSKVARSVRSNLHGPLGVSCNVESGDQISSNLPSSRKEHHSYRDIYAFDRTTSVMLEGITATPPGGSLTIYTYHSHPFFRPYTLSLRLMTLGLSLAKYFEAYLLSTHGGVLLGLLSSLPFTFGFFAATFVEVHDFIISKRQADVDGHIDLVSGPLPTTKELGGPKKIFLGATKNLKISVWWRVFWAISALLQTVSLVMSYFLLVQQKKSIVITWAAFQLAWVIVRILIFHLTESSEPMVGRPMVGHQLDSLSLSMRLRVANLILAVGNYQMHVHPRGIEVYQDDLLSAHQMAMVLAGPNMRQVYELPTNHIQSNSPIQLNIHTVIGDTSLSSAAWMVGSKLTPMELYDSCIIVIDSPTEKQPQRTIAIPAARVFTARPILQAAMTDSENVQPLFIPRGAGARSENEERNWIYWIPCDSGEWLQIKGETVLGRINAEIMDDKQLTKALSVGNLNISLQDAEEVKAIVDLSRNSANYLLRFLH